MQSIILLPYRNNAIRASPGFTPSAGVLATSRRLQTIGTAVEAQSASVHVSIQETAIRIHVG